MVNWTLEERFALWHLFNDNELIWQTEPWWTVFQEVTKAKRPKDKVWDDYGQRNNLSRGAMYRAHIMKPKEKYTKGEAQAYEDACEKLHAAAKKHGIKLPAKPFKAPRDDDDSGNRNDGDDSDHSDGHDEDGDDGQDEDGKNDEQNNGQNDDGNAEQSKEKIQDQADGNGKAGKPAAMRRKKNANGAAEEVAPPRRGRGRPKKAALVAAGSEPQKPAATLTGPAPKTTTAPATETAPKKGRGRPRTSLQAEQRVGENKEEVDNEANITAALMRTTATHADAQQPQPQSKTPARMGNAATRQASIVNRKSLEAQHELLVEVNKDIRRNGALPFSDPAVNQILEEADGVTAKQFADFWQSTGNTDLHPREAGQKRKLDTWDQLPTTKTSHESLPDIQDNGPREGEHLQKKSKTDNAHARAAQDVSPARNCQESQRIMAEAFALRGAVSRAVENEQLGIEELPDELQDHEGDSRATRLAKEAMREGVQSIIKQQKLSSQSTNATVGQSNLSAKQNSTNMSGLNNDTPTSTSNVYQSSASTGPPMNQAKLLAKERSGAFNHWTQVELNRILIGPAYDLFPTSPKNPHADATELVEPRRPVDRLVAFFMHMYSDRPVQAGLKSLVVRHLSKDDVTDKVSEIHREMLYWMGEVNVAPDYDLADVFTSSVSPFSNFRFASAAFGQGLQMLHTKDVDFTGPAQQQLVIFAKTAQRHLTVDDIDFIDHNEPAFMRGGRVHKLYVRQQECPILGEHKKFNTAYVCIDVMLCQKDECETCSRSSHSKHMPITSLPRVHKRHTLGNNVVGAVDSFHEEPVMTSLRHNKEKDDNFMVNLASGVVPLTFWDGKMQDVVVCDPDVCLGCREMRGLKVVVEED